MNEVGYIEVRIPTDCDRCPFGRRLERLWLCDIVDSLDPTNLYVNDKYRRPFYCPIKEKK